MTIHAVLSVYAVPMVLIALFATMLFASITRLIMLILRGLYDSRAV